MADNKHDLKPAPSRLLTGFGHVRRGFGAVTPRQKPEDWRKVREEMEEAI
jgi:hypothetical protein